MDMPTVEAALGLVTEIESMIEDDLSDTVKNRALEFFEGVLAKSKSLGETIELSRVVTTAQMKALENMHAAVSKWVR